MDFAQKIRYNRYKESQKVWEVINLLVYLDNCCYNRPYDDQTYLPISLETQAKLYVQDLIKQKKIDLATSYILDYENSANPFQMRKDTIKDFYESNESVYVSVNKSSEVEELAEEIKKTGIKHKDACHLASAILAECDYFLSTDYRLLKYKTDQLKVMNPIDFIKELEVD